MANYAFIDDNNVVVDLITGRDEDDLVEGITSWEEHYGEIRGMRCLRFSMNTYGNVHINGKEPFRYNPAMIGGVYDEERDAFITPKPPEYHGRTVTLNPETLAWDEDQPWPDDGYCYKWDHEVRVWYKAGPDTPVPDTTKNWVHETESGGWVEAD